MSTLVTVGNALQPFQRLIAAVCKYFSTLEKPVVIQHGNTKVDKAVFDRLAWRQVICRDFIPRSEFQKILVAARLVVAHGGGGIIVDALAAGKVPVVMPRLKRYKELIDNHQVELCRELDRQGRLVLAMEPEDLPHAIDKALQLADTRRIKRIPTSAVYAVGELLRQYERDLSGKHR